MGRREEKANGRRLRIFEGGAFEIRVHDGFAGQIDEVWIREKRSGLPVRHELFGEKRVREEFTRGRLTARSGWWSVPIEPPVVYLRTEFFRDKGAPSDRDDLESRSPVYFSLFDDSRSRWLSWNGDALPELGLRSGARSGRASSLSGGGSGDGYASLAR